ncbi:kunitz-type serine protease inhibitor bitisilin-3 [Megalops cyprinoides]|uniref:kunitz-type serine protease inhibitor bitisilin-3 n=1 Tax=Megalops cyprinoides TaxID=118141 RepID=UPI0018656415|nr:kunitz-type serine protease inhibitor bitisilin-3 [Megalops cyprinoides]
MKRSLVFGLSFLSVLFCTALSMNAKCADPMDQGTGNEQQLKYYFSQTDGCLPFFYKGEGGNGNRFNNESECVWTCHDNPESLYPEGVAVCDLPMEPGPCYGRQLRFHFNSQERTCRTFIYGGCRGNGNRFEDMETCQQTCMGKSGRSANSGPHPDEPTVNTGLIAGIVGGCVFAVAMVAAITSLIQYKTRDRKKVPTKEIEMS